jgi:hypothetical protein
MTCQHCDDGDGLSCFPMYGVGPHRHEMLTKTSPIIGSTRLLPESEWPDNYREDPDCPGCGTYWCPHCGEGKPEGADHA